MEFLTVFCVAIIFSMALSKVPTVQDSCLPSVNNPTYVVSEKCK